MAQHRPKVFAPLFSKSGRFLYCPRPAARMTAFVPPQLSLSAGFQFRMDWIWLGKSEAAKSMAG
jgi:hypothetical protein